MKVRGDLKPKNAFSIEDQPNQPGYVKVRFYENASPFEEKQGDQTMSGWEYDEYHLILHNTGELALDIQNDYDQFLSVAKLAEVPPDSPSPVDPELQTRLSELEQAFDIAMEGLIDG